MSHRHRGQLTGPRSDGSAREAIEYAADAGLRWANEDHLAATDHHPAHGDLHLGRLCEHGQHGECPDPTCECSCHEPGGWGER